ncbi:MAG: hypothetical protein EP325_04855 [Vibrionaceae bacterium]|nr:MAG: hypothetical protein EP325_04855 [Vibrionaceae bacterium]
MGTWSQPNTTTKACELQRLMTAPITRKTACDQLYDLVGDDDLFDFFNELDETDDVRFLVQSHIEKTLKNLHLSLQPWDSEAIEICKTISHGEWLKR